MLLFNLNFGSKLFFQKTYHTVDLCWNLINDDSTKEIFNEIMPRRQSVSLNHGTHRSDVGKGIINAVYVPPLVSFPMTRFLLSKFVFSGIFMSQSVWRRSLWPAGGGKTSLPVIGCVNHVTRPSLRTLSAPRRLWPAHSRRWRGRCQVSRVAPRKLA